MWSPICSVVLKIVTFFRRVVSIYSWKDDNLFLLFLSVHEGTCPVGLLGDGISGICVDSCSSDADCAKDQKCCSNGCGHVCITSEKGEILSKAYCALFGFCADLFFFFVHKFLVTASCCNYNRLYTNWWVGLYINMHKTKQMLIFTDSMYIMTYAVFY